MAGAETREASEALAQVAQAVTGEATPEGAAIQAKPSRSATWALVLAGPALSAMLAAVVAILSFHFWPDVIGWESIELAGKIIWALTIVACVLAGLLGLVVFRLASGSLKSISAKAGPGSIDIQTDD